MGGRQRTLGDAELNEAGARQANLARVPSGVDVAALDLYAVKRIGPLLDGAETGDAIDGHVAQLVESGDHVLTSDPQDMRRLLGDRVGDITLVAV